VPASLARGALLLLTWAALAPVAGAAVPLGGVSQVVTGPSTNCAIASGGVVHCWGVPYPGLPIATPQHYATAVPGVPQSVALALGTTHACALTPAGTVWCWGANDVGQLGRGTTSTLGEPAEVVGLGGPATALAAGNRTSCAVVGGAVKCWGANDTEILGTANPQSLSTQPVLVAGLESDVTGLGVGGSDFGSGTHGCVLQASVMKCWGSNAQGSLGLGFSGLPVPTPAPVTALGGSVAAFATTSAMTCALLADGVVKCWGWPWLGNGPPSESNVPVQVPLPGPAARLHSGRMLGCVTLAASGEAWCWGQVPDGSPPLVFRETPVHVPQLGNDVAGFASYFFSACAWLEDGGARCWGPNNEGQVGNGVVQPGQWYTVPEVVLAREACAGFQDVDADSEFCANVAWIRNRQVTLGCVTGFYCAEWDVSRLQMAAFHNRIGTALTRAVLRVQASPGPLDPDPTPVVCATADAPSAGHPRIATVDGVLSAESSGAQYAVEPVASDDGGATWEAIGAPIIVTAAAGSWRNIRVAGEREIQAGETLSFGLRVSRGGVPGAGTLTDSLCHVRATLGNRNVSVAPLF